MSKVEREVSNLATGIVLKKTKMSADGRQGVIQSINIYPQLNKFDVKYYIERFDTLGNPFTDVEYKTKTVVFRDVGEKGTVTYDDNAMEVDGSYVKTDDEDLQVTQWYGVLGTSIMGSAIAFVETNESL